MENSGDPEQIAFRMAKNADTDQISPLRTARSGFATAYLLKKKKQSHKYCALKFRHQLISYDHF